MTMKLLTFAPCIALPVSFLAGASTTSVQSFQTPARIAVQLSHECMTPSQCLLVAAQRVSR